MYDVAHCSPSQNSGDSCGNENYYVADFGEIFQRYISIFWSSSILINIKTFNFIVVHSTIFKITTDHKFDIHFIYLIFVKFVFLSPERTSSILTRFFFRVQLKSNSSYIISRHYAKRDLLKLGLSTIKSRANFWGSRISILRASRRQSKRVNLRSWLFEWKRCLLYAISNFQRGV